MSPASRIRLGSSPSRNPNCSPPLPLCQRRRKGEFHIQHQHSATGERRGLSLSLDHAPRTDDTTATSQHGVAIRLRAELLQGFLDVVCRVE